MAVSRARLLHHADENAHVVRGKTVSSRPKELTVRGVLEVNNKSKSQQTLPGNVSLSVDQIEKQKIQRTALRRNYCHVQSKIDTGLTARSGQRSARSPLRKEESTGRLATRAALLTRASAKELKNDKENHKENLKETKKPVKINSLKELKAKKTVKDTAESLRQLELAENSDNSVIYEEPSLVLPADIEDIDADNDSPMFMSIYIKDIYRYLTQLETVYPIEENYMKNHNVITGYMRAILIDWLVEVHNDFCLLAETFQLAVGIIDRYLQVVTDLQKEHLQLVGVTATFLASKYEETYPPSIDDFVYVADNIYTKNDIIKCEIEIMKKLDFCISRPTPISFLRRFMKVANTSSMNHHLAKYFVDLCLVECSMVHYRPSELAAAAACLSLHLMSNKPPQEVWTPTLTYYSEYNFAHIEPIIRKIAKIVLNVEKSRFRAVQLKYANTTLAKVSTLQQLKGRAIYAIVQKK